MLNSNEIDEIIRVIDHAFISKELDDDSATSATNIINSLHGMKLSDTNVNDVVSQLRSLKDGHNNSAISSIINSVLYTCGSKMWIN